MPDATALLGLPYWAVLALAIWAVICTLVFAAVVMGGQADDRIERRMLDLAERSRCDEFIAWDADADLADVIPMPRGELAEVVPIRAGLADTMGDADGLGAA